MKSPKITQKKPKPFESSSYSPQSNQVKKAISTPPTPYINNKLKRDVFTINSLSISKKNCHQHHLSEFSNRNADDNKIIQNPTIKYNQPLDYLLKGQLPYILSFIRR